jgi:hypothetical protein
VGENSGRPGSRAGSIGQGCSLGLERLEAVSIRFLERLGLVMQLLIYIPNIGHLNYVY